MDEEGEEGIEDEPEIEAVTEHVENKAEKQEQHMHGVKAWLIRDTNTYMYV